MVVSDENGNVIALDGGLREPWRIDVGAQVAASIAVSSDNAEIEATGELRLVSEASAASYDVLDEIARRVLDARGRAIGVRKDDIPHGKPLAAILRYPV